MISFTDVIGFYQRKIQPGLKVKKNDLVVDLGSGDKPFWRADVFVDNLLIENNQRATRGNIVSTIGNFVNANLHNLPFADNSFDFSFASHVIEHVTNPDKALREIMRVSKSGYLEFPNGFFEMLSPAPSHLWCIFQHKEKLMFVRKSKIMQNVFFGNKAFNRKLASSMQKPFVSLYWKNRIAYQIIDVKNNEKFMSKNEPFTANDSFKKNPYLYLIMIRLIRFFLYKNKRIPDSLYRKTKRKQQ